MRASELVVSSALDSLVGAGLVTVEPDCVRYLPINSRTADLVDRTEQLYSTRPDSVRRAIVSSSAAGLTAFANAFRLRKD